MEQVQKFEYEGKAMGFRMGEIRGESPVRITQIEARCCVARAYVTKEGQTLHGTRPSKTGGVPARIQAATQYHRVWHDCDAVAGRSDDHTAYRLSERSILFQSWAAEGLPVVAVFASRSHLWRASPGA